MTDIVDDKNPTTEFEPLGFHSDSDCDSDVHGEFTKMSNLKNILLNNLSKSDFLALTHFRDEVRVEELMDEESDVDLRHDIETMDDESDNAAEVDDHEEADVVYEGVQEAYDSVFVDQGHGTCTDEDRFALSLLTLMKHICAPHYAYGQIIELIETYILNKVTSVHPSLRSRKTAIAQFARRFQLEPLAPDAKKIEFKSKKVEVVTHNGYGMTMSLLKSNTNKEENMLFPNKEDPFGDLPEHLDAVADIDTGEAFRTGFKTVREKYPKATFPNVIPTGIILYMDKLALDRHGHLSLEPVHFTLTLFNRKARNQPTAWRPVGYIPNLGLQSKAETRNALTGQEKVQLYHDILAAILRQLKTLTMTGIDGFKFRYGGEEHTGDLRFFFLVVLGDTEAHDKLVGKKADRSRTAASICRHCNIETPLLDDPQAPWQYTLQSTLDALIDAGDDGALSASTYHLVQTAWKQLDIKFGGNPRGVNGATPSEPLHQIDLGMFKYEIKEFFIAIGPENCKLHSIIDEWARCVGRYLLHQSDRDLPRTYFPNGLSGGTKLAAHEQIGAVLVLHILLSMAAPFELIVNYKNNDMTARKLRKWRSAFGLQLAWRAWLKQDFIPMTEITLATLGHERLMNYVNKYAHRTEFMQWCIIKFHMVAHITRNALDFGVPANIDTSPMEHNHIDNSKKPSKGTQQRADSIERQTATRYYENLVLQHATDVIGLRQHAVVIPHIPPATVNNTVLQGSRFSLTLVAAGPDDDDAFEYTFAWESRITMGCYSKSHIDWVAHHIGRELGEGPVLMGCTEHTRKGQLFRAHPSYRGGAPWYDWAMFEWVGGDDSVYYAPGQIVMFLHINFVDEPMWFDGDKFCVDEPGLYCLVECFDNPLSNLDMDNLIVEERSKAVRVDVPGWGDRDRISDKCLYLVSVESILGPIAAVPNVGGPPASFILVRPYQSWSEGFTKFLEGDL